MISSVVCNLCVGWGGGGTSSDGPKGRLRPKGLPFSGFKYMKAVPDPELEIRGGGLSHPVP